MALANTARMAFDDDDHGKRRQGRLMTNCLMMTVSLVLQTGNNAIKIEVTTLSKEAKMHSALLHA